ncbi:LysE family transporter [Paenibacillus thiaminolyticus]|uniref:LysE family transporter n=1 Tax=Paenibacillus thiaminolyticus TaxID=49283 RepID=UPI003D2B1A96
MDGHYVCAIFSGGSRSSYVAAATFGISAIVYQSALAFAVVKYAGAAYLLFLAWKSFRDRGSGKRPVMSLFKCFSWESLLYSRPSSCLV